MTNDLIRFVMEKAADRYGDESMFSAACFATSLRQVSGVRQTLDGQMVAAIMVGRDDVERLDRCYYRMRSQ